MREYCYKHQIEYPYSAEEDLGYHPGDSHSKGPVPAPMPAPYYPPGGYAPGPYAPGPYGPAPGGYAPAPGGYAPAPSGYAPSPVAFPAIYPGSYVPSPTVATPAADFSSPMDPPVKPSKGFKGLGSTGDLSGPPSGYGYSSGGYSLPPPPEALNLPKYMPDSYDADEPVAKPSKKPAPADDSDDEDLMERLRKLQK